MRSLAYCLTSTISSSLRGLSASNIVITPSVAVVPVGGWPGLSITRTRPTKWVPHSSRSVRRVGAMPHAAPILTLPKSGTSNSIIPALANNARTGHPPLEIVSAAQRLGHPPKREENRSSFRCVRRIVIFGPVHSAFKGRAEPCVGFPIGKEVSNLRCLKKVFKNRPDQLILGNLILDEQVTQHRLQPSQVFTRDSRIAPKGLEPANKLKTRNGPVRSILSVLKVL